ncbi:flagellar protein FlhE [Pectobacteriaceae bacterium C111]|nr:flagellar protein FlhE [Pectobacteriaceae bacterium C111]
MIRTLTTSLLCGGLIFPFLVRASAGGWNASHLGVTLEYRGVMAASPAFLPPKGLNVSSADTVTVVYWRYFLTSPPPPDLAVKLCSVNRCANLDGASGQTRALGGVPANSEFRFIYYIPGGGRLRTAVEVRSNEISINYK